MKKYLLWMMLILTLAIQGCNCLAGLGEDMEEAGETIEEEAGEHKPY